MNMTFKVFYEISPLGIYGLIPGIENAMKEELMRCYNLFADKANSGITDMLDEDFHKLYPNYFKENSDKEWYDQVKYNEFMADGYNRLICDEMNKSNVSLILDFHVNPKEVNFAGMLKKDHSKQIEFYLREI